MPELAARLAEIASDPDLRALVLVSDPRDLGRLLMGATEGAVSHEPAPLAALAATS
jgi:hypothetical protein